VTAQIPQPPSAALPTVTNGRVNLGDNPGWVHRDAEKAFKSTHRDGPAAANDATHYFADGKLYDKNGNFLGTASITMPGNEAAKKAYLENLKEGKSSVLSGFMEITYTNGYRSRFDPNTFTIDGRPAKVAFGPPPGMTRVFVASKRLTEYTQSNGVGMIAGNNPTMEIGYVAEGDPRAKSVAIDKSVIDGLKAKGIGYKLSITQKDGDPNASIGGINANLTVESIEKSEDGQTTSYICRTDGGRLAKFDVTTLKDKDGATHTYGQLSWKTSVATGSRYGHCNGEEIFGSVGWVKDSRVSYDHREPPPQPKVVPLPPEAETKPVTPPPTTPPPTPLPGGASTTVPPPRSGAGTTTPPSAGGASTTTPPTPLPGGASTTVPPARSGAGTTTPPGTKGATGTTPPTAGGANTTTPPPRSGAGTTTPPGTKGATGTTPPTAGGATTTTPPPRSGAGTTTPPGTGGASGTTPPSTGGASTTNPPSPGRGPETTAFGISAATRTWMTSETEAALSFHINDCLSKKNEVTFGVMKDNLVMSSQNSKWAPYTDGSLRMYSATSNSWINPNSKVAPLTNPRKSTGLFHIGMLTLEQDKGVESVAVKLEGTGDDRLMVASVKLKNGNSFLMKFNSGRQNSVWVAEGANTPAWTADFCKQINSWSDNLPAGR
jgi:hypothetical protein